MACRLQRVFYRTLTRAHPRTKDIGAVTRQVTPVNSHGMTARGMLPATTSGVVTVPMFWLDHG